MKFILEFARFIDIVKSKDKNLVIDTEFKNNERLIFSVYLKKYNKELILKWHNDSNHSMIDRIKSRTSFKSTKDFNVFINDVFNDLFDNHFNEIDKDIDNRYALYLQENNFYILLDIVYENLYKKFTQIYIPTITLSSPNVYKTIIINDEYL